ncbi:MAG: hypothetical protein AAGG72_09000 [Pseudomonadota bacterium]
MTNDTFATLFLTGFMASLIWPQLAQPFGWICVGLFMAMTARQFERG